MTLLDSPWILIIGILVGLTVCVSVMRHQTEPKPANDLAWYRSLAGGAVLAWLFFAAGSAGPLTLYLISQERQIMLIGWSAVWLATLAIATVTLAFIIGATYTGRVSGRVFLWSYFVVWILLTIYSKTVLY